MDSDQCLLKPFFDLKHNLGYEKFDFAYLGFEPGTSGFTSSISHLILVVWENGFGKH